MWEINLSNQILTFLLSLCLGSILCIVYDFIRAIRKSGFNSFWSVFFVDILFSVFAAFITFVFLIARTNGEIRGFVLFGEVLGFIIFRLTFSQIIFRVLLFITKNIVLIFKTINILIVRLYINFEKTNKKLIKYFCSMFKRVKKVLKNWGKVLYTNNNDVIMENDANETKAQT